MRYSLIRSMDICNGEGIGVSLFLQGCSFRCKGCFNKHTWDFKGGKELTKEVQDTFIKLCQNEMVEYISILGGEPLQQEPSQLEDLLIDIKEACPTKTIWLYTGYTYESMPAQYHDLLKYIDILVDGQFIESKKDLKLKFKGSNNQRTIDVQKTLKNDKVVLYDLK